ncbi:hypothetical protein [Pseudomonas paeninsulae]|uniref:hypothetical protein n=1 Tax=Pseudomonas paeninsulae TaxID=3110772 RepID=UPI002D78BA86|nr:hypothetical protein [Pseudomonas sp. IT1137]
MSQIPARPTVTEAMILAAAEVVAAKIDADAATIAEYYEHPTDGFELAKALDKWAGWDTAREDMEALDEVESLVRSALAAAEKQWFAEHDIQPPFPVGAKLQCRSGIVGSIAGIYQYQPAYFEVKPDGQDDAASGSRRLLIKFEDAVAA